MSLVGFKGVVVVCQDHPVPQGISIIILKPYAKAVTQSEKLEWWIISMMDYVTILQ